MAARDDPLLDAIAELYDDAAVCADRRAALRPGGRERYPTPAPRQGLQLPRRPRTASERQGGGAHRPAGDTAGLTQRLDLCRRARPPARHRSGRSWPHAIPLPPEVAPGTRPAQLLSPARLRRTVADHPGTCRRTTPATHPRPGTSACRHAAHHRRVGRAYRIAGVHRGERQLRAEHPDQAARAHARPHRRAAFPGKSGHRIQVSIDDASVARTGRSLLAVPGRQLFRADGSAVTAADVNDRLLDLTGQHITAKDFRTWNGTLAAFAHLRDANGTDRSPPTAALAAIDEAAQRLANTRAVARHITCTRTSWRPSPTTGSRSTSTPAPWAATNAWTATNASCSHSCECCWSTSSTAAE
jgi:DNA topoisomerase I-like protein